MEIQVKVTLDEKTEKVVENLASAINNLAESNQACSCSSSPEILKSVDVDTCIDKYTCKDTDTDVIVVKDTVVEKKIDYEALKTQAKEKTVVLVKAGKGKNVKALLDKFGKIAVSELEDGQLEDFMKELEEIQ